MHRAHCALALALFATTLLVVLAMIPNRAEAAGGVRERSLGFSQDAPENEFHPVGGRTRLEEPTPIFAYYYIWFNASSWNRAKSDFPALGRYSSDEEGVMRQHVRWAKEAGIRGFIVSWKSTDTMNRRLATLVRVAHAEDFNLAVIYQGLNFHRQPQPLGRIEADLRYFADTYGGDRAFGLFGKPLVIWSGTWEFLEDDVRSVTEVIGDDLLVLASERTPQTYGRLAEFVDGNAYYWSSVNPETYPGYEAKLGAMSWAVHSHGGIWLAPAAPGFDARLIGGTSVVDRRDGDTLRVEFEAARSSSPDAIGLISWNEFSENSHIEPSRLYGSRSLSVIADILNAPDPSIPDFDSSDPTGFQASPLSLISMSGLALMTIVSLGFIARRGRRPHQQPGGAPR